VSVTDRLFPIYAREGRSRKRYKAGYINCAGETVIPTRYQDAYPFRNGLASVKQEGLWGVINLQGDFVIAPVHGRPLVFTEGLSDFPSPDEHKIGVISSAGEVIVKPRYRSISHFNGGLACVFDGQLYGFIDQSGNQVIPPFFEDARGFSEGVAAVKVNGAWGYIYPDASTAIPIRYICQRGMAGPFREGLARVARNGRWGHINKEAKFMVEPRFDMAYEFCENRAVVTLDRRAGFVDCEGDIAIPIDFLRAEMFSEGLAAVDTGSGKAHESVAAACETGFIDQKGEFVIPPRFLSTGKFQDGLCITENDKDIAYVNHEGAVVWSSGWVEHLNFNPYHILPPAP
jgi:hypothetical protein